MRVLFDGFWWMRGPRANQHVLREFILGWDREFPDDEVVVAVRQADLTAVRAEVPSRVELLGTRLSPQGVSAILELPLLARRTKADVTVTHNFTPIFGRSCVFVHDLMFEERPEWFTRRERLYFSLMTRTLPRAQLVLTSSKTEARRIERVAKPRRPVVAVGLGVPTGLTALPEEAVAGLGELDGFVLVVGRLNARKNLGNAVAGALRSGRISARYPLVLVGEASGKAAGFSADVQRAVADGSVVFAGFVSDQQLAGLYRRASLFLFLSLDEGFGIPAVEAMSFGAPILASDIEVFHELLGERAGYVDPGDVEAIGAAIAGSLDLVAQQGRPAPIPPSESGYTWVNSVVALRRAVSSVLPPIAGSDR